MFDFLEKLKSKSALERNRIALFFSLGVTVIILFVWVTLSFPEFKGGSIITTSSSTNPSPFETIGAALGEAKEAISSVESEVSEVRNSLGF